MRQQICRICRGRTSRACDRRPSSVAPVPLPSSNFGPHTKLGNLMQDYPVRSTACRMYCNRGPPHTCIYTNDVDPSRAYRYDWLFLHTGKTAQRTGEPQPETLFLRSTTCVSFRRSILLTLTRALEYPDASQGSHAVATECPHYQSWKVQTVPALQHL